MARLCFFQAGEDTSYEFAGFAASSFLFHRTAMAIEMYRDRGDRVFAVPLFFYVFNLTRESTATTGPLSVVSIAIQSNLFGLKQYNIVGLDTSILYIYTLVT